MNPYLTLSVGLILGIMLTGILVIFMMRKKMVVALKSERSFEDTCSTIENVVGREKGWGFPIKTWNFYERFKEKGCLPAGFKKLKVYFVCNTKLASGVLEDTPAMAGIMPCSWAVYEREDGTVWLSKMNIGMMALMFGGVIGKAMKKVEEADEKFLGEVLHNGERIAEDEENAA